MKQSLTQAQTLKLQLDEAIQMLRLVAQQERTCVEVQEWLDRNYPDDEDKDSKPILNLLMGSRTKK